MNPSLPEPFSVETFTPVLCEQAHRLNLPSGSLAFRSISEDFIFRGPDGSPEAALFTVSYLAEGSENRPVMFFWNGGPGSATSALHLECFGPWLLRRDAEDHPVYGLEDNADCLLDRCDLVFVDPVGVGLSRLLNPEKASKYFSVDGDARAAAFLILEWVRRRKRWNSPVYLCGESYGTVRACRVIAELGRSPYSESRMVPGFPLRGVVLIGLAVEECRPEDLVLSMMPAMAATRWYHAPEKDLSQEAFVREACAFAKRDLLPALYEGDDLPLDALRALAGRIAFFTGMPADYFEDSRLRLRSPWDFQRLACPGFTLDLYDARLKTPAGETYRLLGGDNMPLQVMNGLLLPRLNVHTDRLYYTGNLNVHALFNMETEDVGEHRRTHLECLKDGMERTPDLRVLFASGLYDLCTHAGFTRYLVSHTGLPRDRVCLREYPGGHGVYSTAEGKTALLRDIRGWLLKGDGEHA